MKHYIALIFFTALQMSCYTGRNMRPSAIGVLPLHNYMLKQNVTFTNTINYKFFNNAEDFHNTFTITKTSPGTAIVPDFNAQSVVAVILPSSERVITVAIDKAEIAGRDLNVYYRVTDTTSWKTYPHAAKAVAILPKSLDVEKVNFFSNNNLTKTLSTK
ncbi:MAG TPA: hypothetical protein VF540_09445 [Segetibacter sp.]